MGVGRQKEEHLCVTLQFALLGQRDVTSVTLGARGEGGCPFADRLTHIHTDTQTNAQLHTYAYVC